MSTGTLVAGPLPKIGRKELEHTPVPDATVAVHFAAQLPPPGPNLALVPVRGRSQPGSRRPGERSPAW